MTPLAHRRQRGATLLVTLIMLVVLTLFAVTGFNLSSVNLKIVGNFQQQMFTEAMVQQAIEQVMSTVTPFSSPAARCVPGASAPTGGTPPTACAVATDILVDKASCKYTAVAKGYTKKIGELTPEDTTWELRASYTDPRTAAKATIVQGVGVRMLAGGCQS